METTIVWVGFLIPDTYMDMLMLCLAATQWDSISDIRWEPPVNDSERCVLQWVSNDS